MAKSRTVVISEPGGPEVLQVLERDVREPEAGEVRIRVRFAAVNPTDIGTRRSGAAGAEPPWIPGMDASGIVEMLGEGVTDSARR
jgi:NADPH:quinone reductase